MTDDDKSRKLAKLRWRAFRFFAAVTTSIVLILVGGLGFIFTPYSYVFGPIALVGLVIWAIVGTWVVVRRMVSFGRETLDEIREESR